MTQILQMTDRDETTCVRGTDMISKCGITFLTLKPPTNVRSTITVNVTLKHGECMSTHGPLVRVAVDTETHNNKLLLSASEVYSSDAGENGLMNCIFHCYISDPVNNKVSIYLSHYIHNSIEICETDIEQ